jgi:hypothetical protein
MTTHYLTRANAPEPVIVAHRTPSRRSWLARTLCRLGLHHPYVCRAWHSYSLRG